MIAINHERPVHERAARYNNKRKAMEQSWPANSYVK